MKQSRSGGPVRHAMQACGAGFELVDRRERDGPSAVEKALIGRGDFVKLGFVLPERRGSFTVERLWVEISGIAGDLIIGTLANEPVYLPARHGDLVRAELRSVLAVRHSHRRILH